MKKLLFILSILGFFQIHAQIKVGKNTKNLNPNSLFEMETDSLGMLLPRVSLSNTTSFSPLKSHVQGMVIYNLATAGTSPNNVTPGFYYNDGAKWVRLASGGAITPSNTTAAQLITVTNGTGATLTDMTVAVDTMALKTFMAANMGKSPIKDSVSSTVTTVIKSGTIVGMDMTSTSGGALTVTGGTGTSLKATSIAINKDSIVTAAQISKVLNVSPAKDSLTTIINNQITGAAITGQNMTSTSGGALTVTGGTGTSLKATSIAINKDSIVTAAQISKVLNVSPAKDSLTTIINNQITGAAITGQNMTSTSGGALTVTGGTGTSLKATSIAINKDSIVTAAQISKVLNVSPAKDSLTTIINNQITGAAITGQNLTSTSGGALTVTGGTGTSLKATSIAINKDSIVTATQISKVLNVSPAKDSMTTIINNQITSAAITGQNLSAGTLLQTTGTPTGATLKAAGYQVDTTALKTFINSRTTHTMSSATNTITSTVNGIAATTPAVNTVSNTFNTTTRALTTTVNGVAGTAVTLTNGIDSTTASNGLTLTGKNVALGGALTGATTVTTTAANTLAFAGLQSGATTDSIVVANPSTGVIARKSVSSLVREPWQIVGTTNPATSNTDNIYQMGGVVVGTTTASGTPLLQVRNADSASSSILVGTTGNTHGSLFLGNTSHGISRGVTAANDVMLYTTAGTLQFTAQKISGPQMTLDNIGRLGIGTTTPSTALDVNGQVKISGGAPGAGKVLTSDAVGLATWTTLSAGTVTSVSGTAPIAVATGTTTPVISLNDAGVTTIKIADANVTTAKIADGAVTTAKILDGTIATADIANNAVTVAKLPTGATATTFLRGDGTWVTPTDNNTTYTASNGLTLNATNVELGGALTKATTVSGLTATNKMSFTGTGVDAFNIDGSTLSVDALNNRVGIGILTPNATLSIGSNLNNTKLALYDNGSGFGMFGMGVQSGQYRFHLGGAAIGRFSFLDSAAGNELVTIQTTGDVGIGTTLPAAKLDVNGQVKISGGAPGVGKVLTSNAVGLATWTTPNAGTVTSVSGTAPIAVATGTTTPVISLNDAGVTTIKIADANVTTAKIADANVTTAKIADGAVTTAKILDGTIATADIANNAVTVAKLPTGATATTFLRGDGTWVTPTDNNTTYTASNGLTLNGTTVELGGALTKATTISGINATNSFTLHNSILSQNVVNANARMLTLSRQVDPGIKWGNSAGFNIGSYGTTLNSETRLDLVMGNGASSVPDVTVMTWQANGNIGIGTTAPTQELDVVGNVKFSQALMPNNNAGVSGQILTSEGANVPPTWQNNPVVTFGDIKTGLQTADHSGWILLDGRLKTALTANQQTRATALGIGANLPNASNTVLVDNGTALGSVSGSNTHTLAQNQLPNVTLSGTTSTNGNHNHDLKGNNNIGNMGGGAGQWIVGGTINATFPLGTYINSAGDHSHTLTTSSINGGVAQQTINKMPMSLSVNMFLYLGN